MNPYSTLNCKRFFSTLALALLTFFSANSQADYSFTNYSLVSGTDLQVGAVYRFSLVKPGVDALVTVNAFVNGASLYEIDGSSGYDEGFQPGINIDANSNGYVEFKIKFVTTGLNSVLTQPKVYLSSIDVDGGLDYDGLGNPLQEFDEVNMGSSAILTHNVGVCGLTFVQAGNWSKGTNYEGIEYPGRDTTARNVMFTLEATNVNTITYRAGVNNYTAAASGRQRSIYFKQFDYTGFPLSASCITQFNGSRKGNLIELEWALNNCRQVGSAIIEKSFNGRDFTEFQTLEFDRSAATAYGKISDGQLSGSQVYYRLKLASPSGAITYSNTLRFSLNAVMGNEFKFYPSLVSSQATLDLDAAANGIARFQVVDMNGRVMMQRNLQVQKGSNAVSVYGFDQLNAGQYIARVQIDGQAQSIKFQKQ